MMPARSIFRQVTLGRDFSAAVAGPAEAASRRPRDRGSAADRPAHATRFDVLLGLLRDGPARPSLLDLGCGPGLLLDHLRAEGRDATLDYTGVSLSQPMIEAAAQLWPNARFFQRDILERPFSECSFDYVILTGGLTEMPTPEDAAMIDRAERLIEAAFRLCRIGIAFNPLITPAAERRIDDKPWPSDRLLAFLGSRVTRHIVVRGDYGLDDLVVYLYRESGR